MPLSLDETEIQLYRKDGLLFPKTVMTSDQAAAYLGILEAYEKKTGGPVKDQYRLNAIWCSLGLMT